MKLEDAGVDPEKNMEMTAEIICAAQNEPNADFKEGYWCDHWTYNLEAAGSGDGCEGGADLPDFFLCVSEL